jgi:rubrerythrin
MVVPACVMAFFHASVGGKRWVFQGYTAVVLVLMIAFLAAWRCPRCRVLCMGQANPKFCSRCGVRFDGK